MVKNRNVSTVCLIQVEYIQGGKADEEKQISTDPLPWRYDQVRGRPSIVMGDIGAHAHNLVHFISELEVEEVATDVGIIVPRRKINDFSGALPRFNNGARGSFLGIQTAAGVENCLWIRVNGIKGSLEWMEIE